MTAALRVEWWKLRRSPVVLIATLLMVVLVPLLALGTVTAAGAGAEGTLGAKAELLLTGEGWEGFLGVAGQVAAAGMLVGSGVVVAWVFGREFAEGTVAGLFATATPRAAVAAAKLVLVAAWAIVLALAVTAATVLVGLVASVGPVDGADLDAVLRLLVVATSTTLLSVPIGLVASAGRGYLPAIGVVIVLVAVSQVAVLFGAGTWFPYAVPGLLAVDGAPGVPPPSALGVLLAVLVVLGGAWATVRWWRTTEVA